MLFVSVLHLLTLRYWFLKLLAFNSFVREWHFLALTECCPMVYCNSFVYGPGTNEKRGRKATQSLHRVLSACSHYKPNFVLVEERFF